MTVSGRWVPVLWVYDKETTPEHRSNAAIMGKPVKIKAWEFFLIYIARILRKQARSSFTNKSGCSNAAKWPPRSNRFQ
jgi:hypothetical protein